MPAVLMEAPVASPIQSEEPKRAADVRQRDRWLVFHYAPVTLFSLKSSRATSTAGKTLLTPTPYAVKMAFLDAGLRLGLTTDPDGLVRWLAGATLRIGVPRHACVTGTIQSIRQEVNDGDRKRNPALPAYRASIGMREFVHYHGTMRLAFEKKSCPAEFIALLLQIAPAINYFGRRGSFVQYLSRTTEDKLDSAFTQPLDSQYEGPGRGQHATLDDFGSGASFAALNSYSRKAVRVDTDRRFVETLVPLDVYNSGPGFVHYSATDGDPE